MEAPQTEQENTHDVFLRLLQLPIDEVETSLYEYDSSTIEEIENIVTEEKEISDDPKLDEIDALLHSEDFWVNYLTSLGYEVPEGIFVATNIIARMTGRDNVQVLRQLFFGSQNDISSDVSFFTIKWRDYFSREDEITDVSSDEYIQAALDLEYIVQQVKNKRARGEANNPRVFTVHLYSFKIPKFGQKLTFDELVQLVVVQKISTYSPSKSPISVSMEFRNIFEDPIRGQILARMTDQYFALLESLTQENDCIQFVINDYEDILIYYVGSDEQLFRCRFERPHLLIFPEAAASFIEENNIKTREDVINWYPAFDIYDNFGYSKGGKEYLFKE